MALHPHLLPQLPDATTDEAPSPYQAIFESAGIGMTEADPVTRRFLRVNRKFCEITGYSEAELLELTYLDITHPDDRAENRDRVDAVLHGDEHEWSSEKRYVRKDGQIIWVQVDGAVMHGARGQAARTVAVVQDVTDRRRAQQSEREAKQRIHDVLESIGDAFTAVDRQWRVTYANQKVLTLAGMTSEQMVGRDLWELYPVLKGTEIERLYRRAMQQQVIVQFEAQGMLTGKWYSTTVYPSEDGISIFAADVTERKRIEDDAARSRKLLERIADVTPDILFVFDLLEDRNIYVNGASQRILGYFPASERPASFQYLASIVHPEDVERFTHHFNSLSSLRDGEIAEIEYRIRHTDGQYLWLHNRDMVFHRTADGQVAQVMGIASDVTHQREVEQALRDNEQWLRLALGAGGMGVWQWNLATGEVRWDDAIYELTGVERTAAVTAELFFSLIHPDDRERVQADIQRSLAEGTFHIEFRIVQYDGTVRWLASQGGVERTDGQPSRIVGVNFDISQRKQVEESLLEADRRKDEFLAMLGHELRNPLAGIASGIELLNIIGDSEPDAAQTRAIIERQTTQMRHLIDDLLDVSRITRGKINLRKTRLDLCEIAQTCVEDQMRTPAGQSHRIVLELPGRQLWVDGDRTRLCQVLTNLVHNAIKFTDVDGSIIVRLSQQNSAACVEVRDTGIGIAPETIPRLFHPFSQADNSVERSRGGLGLGLALVKGVVELHRGQVWAESAGVGTGSAFYLSIPITEAPAVLQSPTSSSTQSAGGQRVLLIDDQADAALAMRLLMQRAGHTVSVAPDGVAGLAMAREIQPDAILCDIGLPGGLNGYEVAAEIRRDPGLRHVYLVAVTGYGQDEDRREAQLAGFDFHVTKPASRQQLQQILADRPSFSV